MTDMITYFADVICNPGVNRLDSSWIRWSLDHLILDVWIKILNGGLHVAIFCHLLCTTKIFRFNASDDHEALLLITFVFKSVRSSSCSLVLKSARVVSMNFLACYSQSLETIWQVAIVYRLWLLHHLLALLRRLYHLLALLRRLLCRLMNHLTEVLW